MALVISVMSRMLKSSSCPLRMRCRLRNRSVIWSMACLISSVEVALTSIWLTFTNRTGCGVSRAASGDGCG